MRSTSDFGGLEALVADRGGALLATAILLAGDRASGEDLLQAALERVMRQWHRIHSEPEIYLRRAIYRLAVDQWRVRRRRPEVLGHTDRHLEGTSPAARADDVTGTVDLRHALLHALHQLPPRQRAVLVLRYWEHFTEAETARMLGCSVGTVKSTASRALSRLRTTTGLLDADESPLSNGAPS